MSYSILTDRQRSLQDWDQRAVTRDQLALVSLAGDLAARYGSQSTDYSGDAKRIAFVKNWLTWLSGETIADAIPPTRVEPPIRFVVSRMEEEIKDTNQISHNPRDILRGRPGLDARVITKGSNNSWNVSRSNKATRRFGAELSGDILKSGVPVFAGVQLTTSGDRFDVQGELIDDAGAQIGGRKNLDMGAEASSAVRDSHVRVIQTSSLSFRSLCLEPATNPLPEGSLRARFARREKKGQ